MSIVIREAALRDYDDLCRLYGEVDALHRTNHPELFVEATPSGRPMEYVLGMIQSADKALFVADDGGHVVGFAECLVMESPDFPVIKKRSWVQLDGIAVGKEYQGQHIGSMLLDQVVQWTRTKGIDRVELKVYSFNTDADEFYSDKGFRDLSRTRYLDL